MMPCFLNTCWVGFTGQPRVREYWIHIVCRTDQLPRIERIDCPDEGNTFYLNFTGFNMKPKESQGLDRLKGIVIRFRNWFRKHRFPSRVTIYLLGIASTVWFLIRVIPKPSRAGYPCMRAAAPFMSAFVVYLLSLGGITMASPSSTVTSF